MMNEINISKIGIFIHHCGYFYRFLNTNGCETRL